MVSIYLAGVRGSQDGKICLGWGGRGEVLSALLTVALLFGKRSKA